MLGVMQRVVNRLLAFVGILPFIFRPIDFRLLNQHMQRINMSRNINEIIASMAKSMKEVLDYEVFGFALREGSSLQVWLDPRAYSDSMSNRIHSDFPCYKIDGTYYFDALPTTEGQKVKIPDRILQTYRLVDNDVWTGVVYLIPKMMTNNHCGEAIEIILESTRVALDKIITIKKLERDAAHDYLTGCLNRRAMEKSLDHDIAVAERYDSPLSVILFDIDHFKRINDTYGHLIGDCVLTEIAGCMAKMIRKSDYLARYGGEEFVMCLPNTQLHYAVRLAENIRLYLQKNPIVVGDESIVVTASFGVATLRRGTYRKDLLNEADRMLYRAKASGRNVVFAAGSEERLAGKKFDSYRVLPQDVEDTAVVAKR